MKSNHASTAISTLAGLAFITATLTPQVGLAADICADHNERIGLEMRVLQSELMVAALTCGQRADYNTFVSTFKPQILTHSAKLKSFFNKAYGASANNKLNLMVTRLANQASKRSLSQPTSEFCAKSQARFAKILAVNPKQLTQIARANPAAGEHGVSTCVEVANN